MAYEYDVFVSYKRGFPFANWVHEHFLPFFKTFVEGELNRPLKLFIDTRGITAGDSWPERLQRALAHSRCLVPVWSPQYFHSDWCRRECAAMLHREEQLSLRSLESPHGLILPVCVFDGEHFPEPVKRIQYLDCNDYFLIGGGFSNAPQYIHFQQELKAWSRQVAVSIARVPDWSETWLEAAWLDDANIARLLPGTADYFSLPGLE